MKITIHQPEHFPYEGFFQKMSAADVFVILDNVNFRKNYFQNRNKFLNAQGMEEWFGFPVSKKSTKMILKDVLPIDDNVLPWKDKLFRKLEINLGEGINHFYEHESLLEINMAGISWIMKKLKIETPIVYASDLSATGSKSDLLANICQELNAKTYISGPSGKDYLDLSKFSDKNINVDFFEPNVQNYYSMLYNIMR